ncbi:MAG: 7-cyano-7-deazaguanine synthase [Spirochaetota bacterium]|nr:7-cyano-7-deazaguanine synthase [Spirochaetota bacterium]
MIFNILCKLDKDENYIINNIHDVVEFMDKKKYRHNLWKRRINFTKIPKFPTLVGLDLYYLSLFVYYADKKILRAAFEDSWTRNIRLYIPVLEKKKWDKIRKDVEHLLSFLTGDNWYLEFRKRELQDYELKYKKRIEKSKDKKLIVKNIAMLSGGLDSFIGAIDLLEEKKETIFVSLYGGGKGVTPYQNNVKNSLTKKYKVIDDYFFSFYAAPVDGKEDTTRSRSFMFFAHAILIATGMNADVNLYIPENGLISLNIPFTKTRLGSNSTRTTHPHYMEELQNIIEHLGISVKLINPYQFKTKGEMILDCKNIDFIGKNIHMTMSCSHPDQGRWNQESTAQHCGHCWPCIIRRAAIKKASIKIRENYRDHLFQKGNKAKWEKHAYLKAVHDFNGSNNIITIQKAGPIQRQIKDYAKVYSRGMQEVVDLLS